MKIFIITYCFVIFPALLFSQEQCRGIDTVWSFTPGEGQNIGQGEEFYPENIFGFPSKVATYQVPEQTPDEILSLGFDGEIIVGFKDLVIEDRDGADFIIFENAFQNPATKKLFVEPAKVAVSSDGINFIEFEYDEETLAGCAGITPTTGDGNPCDQATIGGDAFDISDLGLDHISHIRITDISRIVKSNPNHIYYDPIITGFDLDAVVGLHLRKKSSDVKESDDRNFSIRSISTNMYYIESFSTDIHIIIYDIKGSAIFEKRIDQHGIIDCSQLSAGIYLLKLSLENKIFTEKIIVY
jgi:hypothetical protein